MLLPPPSPSFPNQLLPHWYDCLIVHRLYIPIDSLPHTQPPHYADHIPQPSSRRPHIAPPELQLHSSRAKLPFTHHFSSPTQFKMASDLDQLVDMGFPRDRAEIAMKASGNLTSALDWLEKNQDKSLDDIKAEQADASAEPPELKPGEEAKSLVCDDCGKKFRSVAQAEFHGTKSGHENFSESTEEIAPLTEEEKKQRLADLKEKLAAKRAVLSEQDKEDKKRNEQIRMKATKESQDIKEALQNKERIKEAQAKRAEKAADLAAKKRVLEKLEADKQERKRKAEAEKAVRAGKAPPPRQEEAPVASSSGPTTSKPASEYKEARLALQTPSGRVMKTFPVETTLFEVAHALEQDGLEVNSFMTNFPKKTYDRTDFGMTLKEAGFVPSAALILK